MLCFLNYLSTALGESELIAISLKSQGKGFIILLSYPTTEQEDSQFICTYTASEPELKRIPLLNSVVQILMGSSDDFWAHKS